MEQREKEEKAEEVATLIIYIYKEECLCVCVFVCLFVRDALSPCYSYRHQTFHNSFLSPGKKLNSAVQFNLQSNFGIAYLKNTIRTVSDYV